MKKTKINMDRPGLSGSDISAGKDFNSLYQQYSAVAPKPWFKSTGFIAGFAGALVVVVTIFYATSNFKVMNKPFIMEPVAGAGVKFAFYQFEASTDTSFTYATGTVVKIPAKAFLYEDGSVAQGKVDIKYREFHDAVDIFLSGIPMAYDSAGIAGHLESGGMLEFEASQNGKVLKPNPASLITMDFVAQDKGSFNLYYLDTVERKWVYNQPLAARRSPEVADPNVSNDTAYAGLLPDSNEKFDTSSGRAQITTITSAQLQTKISEVQQDIAKIEKTEPIKPLEANQHKRQFTLEVKPDQFPEISSFKDVLFEPEDGQKITDADYSTVWEDVVLKDNKKGKDFIMTLTKGDSKLEVVVVPVYEGENLAKAVKEFNKKFAAYSTALKNRKDEEARLVAQAKKEAEEQQKKYEKQMANYAKARKADSISYEAALLKRGISHEAINSNAMVTQSISLLRFGYANCDRIFTGVTTRVIAADYKNEGGSKLTPYTCYLLFGRYNTVVTLNSYSPTLYVGQSCLLITVSNDGKTMMYPVRDYMQIGGSTDVFTFKMQDIKDKANLSEELKKYLKGGTES